MKRRSWYPIEDGKVVIEIKADNLSQLFDKRDPNPFRIKDLDDDAVEYIISSAQEIGVKKLGKLRILTLDEVDEKTISIITNAVKDYFIYRADINRKKIASILGQGVKALFIGMTFLALAIFAALSISKYNKENFWGDFFKEGLLLIGWVSLWKPINIFFYEWWPLVDLRKIYLKLSLVDVEIQQIEPIETHIEQH